MKIDFLAVTMRDIDKISTQIITHVKIILIPVEQWYLVKQQHIYFLESTCFLTTREIVPFLNSPYVLDPHFVLMGGY